MASKRKEAAAHTSSSSSLPATRRPTVVTYTDPQQPNLFFTAFNELRQLERFCDLELCVKETKFTGHKLILASGSPYLMELVSQNDHGYIELKDTRLDPYAISILIEFLYTSSLCISENTVLDLCYASQVLRMGKIQKSCCKFIRKTLTFSNVIPYLFFCHDNKYNTLGLRCSEFALSNINKIIKEESFLEMSREDLTKFIEILNLHNTREEMEAVHSWSEYNMREGEMILLQYNPLVQPACHPPPPSSSDLVTQIHTEGHKLSAHQGHLNPDELKQRLKIIQENQITPPASIDTHKALANQRTTERTLLRNNTKDSDSVLIAIGGTSDHNVTDTCERFSLRTQEWSSIAKLPYQKSQAPSVVYNSRVYSIGGYNGRKRLPVIDVYDPLTNKWTQGPSLPHPLSGSTAVVIRNRLFIIGGYDGSKHLSDVKILNLENGEWKRGPPLNIARSYCKAGVLQGTIFVVGGANEEGRLNSVEMWPPGSSTWAYASCLKTPRSRPGLGIHGNQLYTVGGYDGKNHLSSAEVYDVVLDRWTPLANLRTQRNSPGVTVAHGAVYAAGGHNGMGINKSVEIYEPRMSTWLEGVAMTTRRCDFSLVTCSKEIAL